MHLPPVRTAPFITLLLLVSSAATAGPKPKEPKTSPAEIEAANASAEAERQRAMMEKRAQKNAWSGVEAAYKKLTELEVEFSADDHMIGADAARNVGDSWKAYQRLVLALKLDNERQDAHDTMRTYRESFGRLTIRRVEATGIEFSKVEPPFTPDARASVSYATTRLLESGGFDGMVPVGEYKLGDSDVLVVPGLKPLLIHREIGDGEKK